MNNVAYSGTKMPRYSRQGPSPRYWHGRSKRNDVYRPAERPDSQNEFISIHAFTKMRLAFSFFCSNLTSAAGTQAAQTPSWGKIWRHPYRFVDEAGMRLVAHRVWNLGQLPTDCAINKRALFIWKNLHLSDTEGSS